MSEQSETSHPATAAIRKGFFLYWLNLVLLVIIVLAVNYVSYNQYYRRDLTEDQRYDISQQTINVLKSKGIAERETPIRLIFAFQRTTQNYTRMRALLEEYERYSNGNVEVECIDPLRQPNRAREIALIYDVEFNQNQVVIDAREDTSRSVKTIDNKGADNQHVRKVSGKDFIVYEQNEGGQGLKAVALQMEDILTANLISAVEGTPKKVYISFDKSNFGADAMNDETSIFYTMKRACGSLNLELVPLRLGGLQEIPQDAEAFMLVGSQYDLTPAEIKVISEYWDRNSAGMFIALDPHSVDNKNLYRFLREQGIWPMDDRVMLMDRKKAFYEINALFANVMEWTKDFWNQSTALEGESFSMKIDASSPELTARLVRPYPLLYAAGDYYGETKYNQLNPSFNVQEDNQGPLLLAAAVERGNTNDINLAKQTARMVVMSNIDMLDPQKIKHEQRDFIRASLSWITDREELSGISSRHDLTIKLNLDHKAVSIVQLLVNIVLPVLALLIGLVIWNTRRN